MKKIKRRARRMTPPMLVSKYSGGEKLRATAENFPALKSFWDMNHIDGAWLLDTVGTHHLESSEGKWFIADDGRFAKWTTIGSNHAEQKLEAPGDRDIVMLASGLVTRNWRPMTIGAHMSSDAESGVYVPPGVAFDLSYPALISPPGLLDKDNYTNGAAFSFKDEFSLSYQIGENVYPNLDNPGVTGCLGTVVSPSAGTASMHWAGRTGVTAAYDPGYEAHDCPPLVGSIQGTWPELGDGLSTWPGNRFEWIALLYFESGAPNDLEEAMRWMAQYDDFRLYPGWKGKQ